MLVKAVRLTGVQRLVRHLRYSGDQKDLDGNLKGKVAWITGAGSGIGKSLAQHWATLGVKLVLTDIDEESLTKFDDHLKRHYFCQEGGVSEGDILLLPGDITDVSHHDKWLKEILNKFGKLDILVNNAGRMSQGSLMMPMSAQKSQFEVNVFSHVALTQAVLPYFLEQKQGHIVAVSSLLALLPLSKLAPYSASKATILLIFVHIFPYNLVQSYFTSLRAELWRHNIPVTVLCPGPVGTRLLARTPEPEEKAGDKVCAFTSVVQLYIL
ncbi:unnamed protein product [Notodromas monacha]|uniref:Uncharacterized protein n=1 Tax=Notodromas monacha TaxID=399045 RepID=A0A7R9BEK5_9CRUS|nr:unnamed protein product [Notodromas monacha]CAG0913053.1 unnamed protein product [Notodromas monacha]